MNPIKNTHIFISYTGSSMVHTI